MRFVLILLLITTLCRAQPVEKRSATSEGRYGSISTQKRIYRPLDSVQVQIRGRAVGDRRCRIRVADPVQRVYFEQEVALVGNRGAVSFPATGPLGAHYVYLLWPGETRYSRYLNFRLEAETGVEAGDPDFDRLFPFSREAMQLGRRDYQTVRGRFVGYISADTLRFDGIWLRDWIYSLPGYQHWEQQMLPGLDRFFDEQGADGMIPDGIHRNGRTWRVGLESDVEYILVLGAWQSWQATGDDAWLRGVLPRLERAIAYVESAPRHWDAGNQLIKRQHSCDTWDYDIDGAGDHGNSRHVIATCDQSGYFLAYQAMSRMYRHLGDAPAAERWATKAREYRERAVKLLWDGVKFLHHAHLDPIDHGDFDESKQLAMGNTWAITRGLANPQQAVSIIDEYRRRHRETGDAYPWWSLQPGYPDHLKYWKDPFRLQGGYANGGLMPWVGGELCRGAFQNGREAYGVELLRQYAAHLRKTGGAQVWYWPDGTPGFRTTNEVNYAGWGMGQWVQALLEGLGGIRDQASLLREVEVSPRWAATPAKQARVTFRYAASDGYFSYVWKRGVREINLDFTGSGELTRVRILLPAGAAAQTVRLNGKPAPLEVEQIAGSQYVVLTTPALRGSIAIRL
ncbi:MAG: hypothetical protein SF339_18845 [Blastocatellia bacterium]|nr:hypothetical protein [Blastocatellia bacterium]